MSQSATKSSPMHSRGTTDYNMIQKAMILKKLVEEGKTRRFWLEEGLIYTMGNHLYVPKVDSPRIELLRKCHETLDRTSRCASYFDSCREHCTSLTWGRCGGICEDLSHVSVRQNETCITCRIAQVSTCTREIMRKSLNGLHPSVATSASMGSILVVVDCFSKYATFIPVPRHCYVEHTTRLILKNVVNY